MLEDFLSKLGASTKITVGVSISPSVGLEMIEVDKATGTVSKYSNRALEYNHSTREIANYEEFRNALEELFEELHIPKKNNIVLSLPNVYFGMINLPLLLADEAITNAIVSEVEQSYIFKRQEPVISWCDVYSNVDTENRALVYTAIQQTTLDQINEICDDIGCTIISIENSHASLLKALDFSGLAKEQMKDKTIWNLMIIGQNSYSIMSMSDKRIMEYYEEPLALKSFIDDEIYNAITISAQLTLTNLPANYLYIISETDLVSAEVLAMKIGFEGKIEFLECNKFAQKEILPVNLNILPKNALRITLESIGSGIYQFSDYPLKLNAIKEKENNTGFLNDILESPKINIGNLEIELTPGFLKRVSLIVGGAILVPTLILFLILIKFVIPQEQAKLDSINTQVQQLSAEIAKYSNDDKNGTFDVKAANDNIVKQNRIKLTYYSALGISIPNKLWITYYAMSNTGKIDIKGNANDVKSIYIFYKNLKNIVNQSDIRLYKLEISSGSLDDIVADISSSKIYEFEITNLSDSELNPNLQPASNQSSTGSALQQPAVPSGQNGTNQPFQLGKPLFGSQNNTPPAGGTSTTPSPSSSADGLPKNLEKIEKF